MIIRRLTIVATGAAMALGCLAVPAAAGQASPATPSCAKADTWYLANHYGNAIPSPNSPYVWIDFNAQVYGPICDQPGAGENNWDRLEDLSAAAGQCLTWNKSANDIYDASCGRYPASQSWGFISQSGGTQIENYYGSKCLGGNSNGGDLYLYECAPNGDLAQDWGIYLYP